MSGARLELDVPSHQHQHQHRKGGGQQQGLYNIFRVGIFLGFVRRSGTTRAEGPHGGVASHVRGARRNELTIRVLTDDLTAPFSRLPQARLVRRRRLGQRKLIMLEITTMIVIMIVAMATRHVRASGCNYSWAAGGLTDTHTHVDGKTHAHAHAPPTPTAHQLHTHATPYAFQSQCT